MPSRLQNPAVIAGSLLPETIPPPTLPWGRVQDEQGNVIGESIVDVNWYLFLYNLAKSVLAGANGSIPVTPSDFIALSESDVTNVDALQTTRSVANAVLLETNDLERASVDALQSPRAVANLTALEALDIELARSDIVAVAQRAANAYALAVDALVPDTAPQAQPAVTVTVGASPFTYTAAANGVLAVSAGTVSAIALLRQSATVATGVTAGLVPVSRLDQVKITYTVAPAVVFLPT